MSCQGFEERIALYAGGELTTEEALPVLQHLRSCTECAELARGIEEDRLWLSRRPSEAMSIDYPAMRRRIREEIAQSRGGWRWLASLLAAAAVVLLTLGIATMRRTHHPIRPAAAGPVAQAAPVAATPSPVTSIPRPYRPKPVLAALPQPPLSLPSLPLQADLTLEAAIRMFEELEPAPPAVSNSPVEMRIATRDPNVTIILIQESNGDSQ